MIRKTIYAYIITVPMSTACNKKLTVIQAIPPSFMEESRSCNERGLLFLVG